MVGIEGFRGRVLPGSMLSLYRLCLGLWCNDMGSGFRVCGVQVVQVQHF